MVGVLFFLFEQIVTSDRIGIKNNKNRVGGRLLGKCE